ncbi:MFS transporter [Rhizobium hainanense]|uniref:Putative tartrate transporter n=1 Tax=Rhizobium hainanense TaxID=52131 RepID=A0A1C3W991_9HYPH|nr:MFS transporter [Rhizobium hainanense]SCB36476.1 D-galactonate transporter [Rhizobium hainanense]
MVIKSEYADSQQLIFTEKTTYSKVFWRLLPFLLSCYIVSYLDRVNVGFAKLQMLDDLGFSEAVYGLGAGVFFIGYVIFEVPSNMVMMRVGPKLWICRIMITWGIISALMAVVTTPTSFYLLRFLLGAAEAGFIPAVLYYLTLWFPTSQRGKATAIFMTGIPLSGVLGGPLSGWIISGLHEHGGMAGWQWMFILEAIPAILLGIMCYFYLNNSVDSADWLTEQEKAMIKADVAREAKEKPLHSTRDGLVNPKVWMLSGIYFFFTMGLYGISFWLPSIIRESGIKDPLTVGLLTAIPYTGALVFMVLVGRSSDRAKERRWHLAAPAILGAIGLVISIIYSHNTTGALIAMTVAAMGILTCIPQFYTLPPAILSGAAAAMGLAIANSVGSVAGFVSPYLIGWVKDATGSTDIGVSVVAVALLIGAGLVLAQPARLLNR